MKHLLFLILPFFLLANDSDLERCYKAGDGECGLLLAQSYKDKKQFEKASEIYLNIMLKTESGVAAKELGKIYIYNSGKQTQENCKKGVSYLFNGLTAKNPDKEVFLELSKLFREGVCVPKSEEKAEKYKNVFFKNTKEAEEKKNADKTKPFNGIYNSI